MLNLRKINPIHTHQQTRRSAIVRCDSKCSEDAFNDNISKAKTAYFRAQEKRKKMEKARIDAFKSMHTTFKSLVKDEVEYVRSLFAECAVVHTSDEITKADVSVDASAQVKTKVGVEASTTVKVESPSDVNRDVFVDKL